MKQTYFIAEISSNHSRDIDRAIEFIDTVSKIGCDAVKFQLFKIDRLFSPEILENSKKLRDRKKWELPVEFLPKLLQRCKEKNIQFSCTPFYLDAVKELEDKFYTRSGAIERIGGSTVNSNNKPDDGFGTLSTN